MTVKDGMNLFTDAEIDTIADALKIAASHYLMMADIPFAGNDFRETFQQQSRDARALQLKIEASK